MIQFFYEHSELHGFKCVNPGRTTALISMRGIVNINATVSHKIVRMKFSNLNIFVVDD